MAQLTIKSKQHGFLEYSLMLGFKIERQCNNLFSGLHSIKVGSTSVGVCSHSRDTQPVSYFNISWHSDILSDDVETVASHPEQSRVFGFKYSRGFLIFEIYFRIELLLVLETHAIH